MENARNIHREVSCRIRKMLRRPKTSQRIAMHFGGEDSVSAPKVDRERYHTKANVNKVRGMDHGGAQSQG